MIQTTGLRSRGHFSSALTRQIQNQLQKELPGRSTVLGQIRDHHALGKPQKGVSWEGFQGKFSLPGLDLNT